MEESYDDDDFQPIPQDQEIFVNTRRDSGHKMVERQRPT